MKGPASYPQLWIAAALSALMIVTRSHHWTALTTLPDASWAVLFLAGVYLRASWMLPALCVLAAVVDGIAISFGGVSAFCVTPAYAMLLPAYASLWLAGRACQVRDGVASPWSRLLPVLLVAAVAAEVFASGGFNYLGGQVVPPSLADFLALERRYFPPEIVALVLYVGLGRLVERVLAMAAAARRPAQG